MMNKRLKYARKIKPYVHAYQLLAERAKTGGIVNYGELMSLLNVDRFKLNGILFDISVYEHLCGRPLLSAIVVRKGSMDTGAGFYRILETGEVNLPEAAKMSEQHFEAWQMGLVKKFWHRRGIDIQTYKELCIKPAGVQATAAI